MVSKLFRVHSLHRFCITIHLTKFLLDKSRINLVKKVYSWRLLCASHRICKYTSNTLKVVMLRVQCTHMDKHTTKGACPPGCNRMIWVRSRARALSTDAHVISLHTQIYYRWTFSHAILTILPHTHNTQTCVIWTTHPLVFRMDHLGSQPSSLALLARGLRDVSLVCCCAVFVWICVKACENASIVIACDTESWLIRDSKTFYSLLTSCHMPANSLSFSLGATTRDRERVAVQSSN